MAKRGPFNKERITFPPVVGLLFVKPNDFEGEEEEEAEEEEVEEEGRGGGGSSRGTRSLVLRRRCKGPDTIRNV